MPELRPAKAAQTARLILISNRGPVEHWFDENQRIRRRDAAGGVATALSAVAKRSPVTWLAAACSDADKAVAILGRKVRIGLESDLRLVQLPDSAYHQFYESFCNPILWFVQHSLGGLLGGRDLGTEALASWHAGYLPVNRRFAEAAIEEIPGDGLSTQVMLHDYHLYLAPRFIRAARPFAALQQFVHIPWPSPSEWRFLPSTLVRQICASLLANDSVVFQTEASVENFLATCRDYLGERARVRERYGSVEFLGHSAHMALNPVSVDIDELKEVRSNPQWEEYRQALAGPPGMKTIVRVDRLDPSKNVERGFEAFELLLRRDPGLHGRVRFLAFLVPSRCGIPEYAAHAKRVFDRVNAINASFGRPDWTPISVFYEHNRLQALAGLSLYDVLLVNSVADGMNLVSKEGPVVNANDGVLVLSETAGSFEELRHGAIGVNPYDVCGTAAALHAALAMEPAERRIRQQTLRDAIHAHQITDWLRQQLKDLSIAEHMKRIAAEASA